MHTKYSIYIQFTCVSKLNVKNTQENNVNEVLAHSTHYLSFLLSKKEQKV